MRRGQEGGEEGKRVEQRDVIERVYVAFQINGRGSNILTCGISANLILKGK